MREVAVIGVGMTSWGKFPDTDLFDLGADAAQRAVEDAGVEWTDIESLVSGVYKWGSEAGLASGQSVEARLGETGIPVTNVYQMCASATNAFRLAYLSIASGECDLALALGLDKSPKGFFSTIGREPTDTMYLRWSMVGLSNPAYWALDCRQRMEKYGTTEAHLAKVKVATSKHGALNPNARYRKVFTVEEVLNSAMVCDPLRLYEICATSDGAAAAVLCSMDKAKKYTSKPIIIAGVGLGSSVYGDISSRLGVLCVPAKEEAPFLSESAMASKMAYEKAGVGPESIDFVELPDNSSWHYLQYLETLGFCGPGEADHLLDEDAFQIGGKLPVCPSGGVSSFGEALTAQGLAQICEVVWQLRGDARARQVEGAKVGMSQTYGMFGNSGCAILKC